MNRIKFCADAIEKKVQSASDITDEKCKSCKKDWTKCGTCPDKMQWVKELREKNKREKDK